MPKRDWTWPQGKWPMTWHKMWKCEWWKHMPFSEWKWNKGCGSRKWEGNRRSDEQKWKK